MIQNVHWSDVVFEVPSQRVARKCIVRFGSWRNWTKKSSIWERWYFKQFVFVRGRKGDERWVLRCSNQWWMNITLHFAGMLAFVLESIEHLITSHCKVHFMIKWNYVSHFFLSRHIISEMIKYLRINKYS